MCVAVILYVEYVCRGSRGHPLDGLVPTVIVSDILLMYSHLIDLF